MDKKILLSPVPRKNILITWLFGSILLMLLTSVLSMLVWNYNAQGDPLISLRPIDHLFDMAFRVPVGWFLSFLDLFGWINLFFLCLSIYTKLCVLLIGSALATILSGIWWPMLYISMLG